MTSQDNGESTLIADGVERERLVLHPVGELDYFTARNLLDALKRHLSSYHTQIVLDLTSLSFCDSSGVSLASSIGSLAADRGIGFELRRADNHVGRVFELLPT